MAKLNAVPFHQKEYWESRFEKEKHFEWLLTWQHIQTELEPYFDKNENILHPGIISNLSCSNQTIERLI